MPSNPLLSQKINQWVFFLIPLAFMVVTPWPLSELSLWVGYGEHLWKDWHFLYHDSVSFLPTDNNTTSAWLISLLYYGLHRFGGLFLVAHFHHLVLVMILAFIYRKTLFRNPWPWPWKERAGIYVFWLGTAAAFSLRPALLAFGPFLFSYSLLDHSVKARTPLTSKNWLQLTLCQILWVNLHGSFVLLPLMTGWVLITQRLTLKNVLGFLSLIASLGVNPFGYSILEYVLRTREASQLLGITEWASAFSFAYPLQFFAYWSLALGTLMFLARAFKEKSPGRLSPFVPLVLIPLLGLRLSVFAFCALPFFLLNHGFLFQNRPKRDIKRSPLGPALALIFIGAFVTLGSPYLKTHFRLYFPPHLQDSYDAASVFKIAERLRAFPKSCPILNDFNVGGVLMNRTSHSLFMDGRVTPFTRESLERYSSFMKAQKVEDLLLKANPCFAVLSVKSSEPLVKVLLTQFHFRVLEIENEYVLLERKKQKGSN